MDRASHGVVLALMAAPRKTGGGVTRQRFTAGKQRREEFLKAITEGCTPKQARERCGWVSANSYYVNRKQYPVWAGQVDLAKAAAAAKKQELLDGQNDRKLAKRQMLAQEDNPLRGTVSDGFRKFVGEFFPDRRPHLSHQLKIVEELHNLRPREVCLFLLWPEAGKTSTLEDYMCRHLASSDPNHRFRIISEGQDLAKRIVGTCQRRFKDESNYGKFIGRYGPFYEKGQERQGRPWTTDQFTILTNNGGERDRSIVASGWSGAVYGSRIDTLIVDDVQSQGNFSQSETIFNTIRGTFLNRGLEMRTLIVGTRIGPGDVYERMLEAGLITRKVILPAALPNGEPTVPEFWDRPIFHSGPGEAPGPCCSGFRSCPQNGLKLTPREFMELIRHQSGEDVWWSAYQQVPAANSLTTFGSLLDRCLDKTRSVGELPVNA